MKDREEWRELEEKLWVVMQEASIIRLAVREWPEKNRMPKNRGSFRTI